MTMEKLTDDHLLNFLDDNCTAEERQFILNALTFNPVYKKRLDELQLVHQFLKNKNKILSPSKNYTEK